jgi:hypothetical protein
MACKFEVEVRTVSFLRQYCRVPPKGARTGARSPRSVAFIELRAEQAGEAIYLAWNGELADSNCLEIPCSDAHTSTLALDCGMYVIQAITTGVEAQDVCLRPASLSDWEIISTQAEYVEANMLRNHSILFVGQLVRVQMGPTLYACLVVTAVKTTYSGAGTVRAAQITNRSVLVIEPYKSPSELAQAVETAQQTDWSKVDYESKSHLQTLFVLSQQHAKQDSSFHLSCHNEQEVVASIDLDEAYLDSFLNSATPNISLPNTCEPCAPQVLGFPEHDQSTCRVHPLYFIACFEAVLGSQVNASQWTVIEQYLQGLAIIACVERCSQPSDGHNPVTPHAVVRVMASAHVRPGCCILSSSVRRGMCLLDYDPIRLYLVTNLLGGTVLPHALELKPVSGEVSGTAPQAAEAAKIEVERWIQRAHAADVTVILHDQQLLSLVMPTCTAGADANSGSVSRTNFELDMQRREFLVTVKTGRATK